MHAGARSLAEAGKLIDAAAMLEREVAAMRLGHPFRDGELPVEAAPLLEQLGTYRWHLARFDGAAGALAQARALREANGDGEAALAGVVERQAALAHYRGDAQAGSLFRRAIRARAAAHGPESLEATVARRNFGAWLRDGSHKARAREELGHALQRLRQLLGASHHEVASALKAWAMFEGSLLAAEDAVEAALRAYPDGHPFIGGALILLGRARARKRDYREATLLLNRAEEILAAGFGPDHPLVAIAVEAMAELAGGMGDQEQAAELAAEATRVYAVVYHGHPFLARMLHRSAKPLQRLRRWAEALTPMLEAARIFDARGERADALASEIAMAYEQLGRAPEARAWEERIGRPPPAEG